MTEMDMDEASPLKLECPKCGKENNIKSSVTIRCGECKEDLTENIYKEKPWLLKPLLLLFVGAIGWPQIKDFADIDNRYPLKTEVEILDACRSNSRKPVARNVYIQKSEVCVCALDMTQNSMNFGEFKDSTSDFLRKFDLNAEVCIDELGG